MCIFLSTWQKQRLVLHQCLNVSREGKDPAFTQRQRDQYTNTGKITKRSTEVRVSNLYPSHE